LVTLAKQAAGAGDFGDNRPPYSLRSLPANSLSLHSPLHTPKRKPRDRACIRFVVKLNEKTCSCREWQVSGIPCVHAIAFITSLDNEPLENYVDCFYFVEKFQAAYAQLIPALDDKSQWPKSNHVFSMHPPLLKSVAGRRQVQRFRSCTKGKNSTTRKKGQHQCPTCKGYGHHWHNCKEGDPDDIAAMMAVR
jgi:hypothetical protein